MVSLGRWVLNAGRHAMKVSLGSVVGVVLIGAAVVCADVPVVSSCHDVESASLLLHRARDIAQPGPVESPRPVQQAAPLPGPRSPLGMALGTLLPRLAADISIPHESGPKTIVLPADLSSITMFLTAIGSMGAWQFVRSARGGKFHFGHMPEWYHTGGPTQIGHTAAIDPQFQPHVLSPLDTPVSGPALVYRLRRDVPLQCRSQFSPTLTAPRGPPLLRH